MTKVLQADLTALAWFLGYAEYGDAILIGAFCGIIGIILTAFCIMTETVSVPVESAVLFEEVEGEDRQ